MRKDEAFSTPLPLFLSEEGVERGVEREGKNREREREYNKSRKRAVKEEERA